MKTEATNASNPPTSPIQIIRYVILAAGVGLAFAAASFYIGEEGEWERQVRENEAGFFFDRFLFAFIAGCLAVIASQLVAWLGKAVFGVSRHVTWKYAALEIACIATIALVATAVVFYFRNA